ncbi:MAG: nicotinate (nicotinamide) nucleotide adenylyltransferase [Nanoarchaeota archaeon]
MKLLNRRVGLYFGSFNPIHVGHLVVAKKALDDTDLDEVWFVVSPQNPHKKNSGTLEDEFQRLEMVKKAVADEPGFSVCDVEFNLPKPSYTHDALRILRTNNPETKFSIVAGSDTQRKIGRWRSWNEILNHHDIIVYPRVLTEKDENWPLTPEVEAKSVYLQNIPVIDVSATYIREHIQTGKSIKYLVPDVVIEHIKENNLYKK